MELSFSPPVRVYFGVATHQSGDEGDAASLLFDFEGVASWDGITPIKVQGMKCSNPPTEDVKIKAPGVNTPAMFWEVRENAGVYRGYLILLLLKIPFTDCA